MAALRSPRAPRGQLLRPERRLAARGRSRRDGLVPSFDGREGNDPADARRGSEPLRARPHVVGRPRRDASSRSRGRRRSTRISSTPASTCSSRRCSTSCPGSRRLHRARGLSALATEGSVFGIALPGYWLDVGTPESYLQAHRDVLERVFSTRVGELLGADFMLVDDSAEIHPAAKLVPPVYVGPGAVVEEGARLGSLAVLGAGARLGEGRRRRERGRRRAHEHRRGRKRGRLRHRRRRRARRRLRAAQLAVVGPGARVGTRNVLDHGLRIGAGQTVPDEALRFS